MSLLAGKNALIAGIGPGLGREIAVRFAAEGAATVLGARRADSLESVAAELRARGARTATRTADVTDAGDCRALVEAATEELGGLDLLVVNASRRANPGAPVEDADLDDWKKSMDVNLWGAAQLAQAAIPAMRARGGGSIVVVSAMTTRVVPAKGRGDYAISKAALNQLVRNLAYEVGEDGIRVNAVVPGWMDGPTMRALLADTSSGVGKAMVDEAIAEMPLGRIPTPHEVAGSILFFASDLAGAVTGQALDVNAGQYMNG